MHQIVSPHTVLLRNTDTKEILPKPVHLDRLKLACVRSPNPGPYFSVDTSYRSSVVTTATQTLERAMPMADWRHSVPNSNNNSSSVDSDPYQADTISDVHTPVVSEDTRVSIDRQS